MKKILLLVFLAVAVLLPQATHAASTPFTFTAKMAQPTEGTTIKTGSTLYLFVKVAPPETGTGFKTNFIVTWPDGSSQIVSSTGLDLDVNKVINGPVGTKNVSVFAVMSQTGNSYVATQTLTGKVNITSGPLTIASSAPVANKSLKSGSAQNFSVQVAGGQAPYKVTWSFPDGKSAVANANAQGVANTTWVPNGQSGKKLVLIAVTDQAKKTVLQNQYVIVDTAASPAKFHDAEINKKDYVIDGLEIAYVVSLYNAKTGSYGCGTTAGIFSPDSTNRQCTPFNGDINKNWKIELSELMRVSQLYNSGGYTVKAGTEDGFAPTAKVSLDDSDNDSQDSPSLLSQITDGLSNLVSQAFGGVDPQTQVGATAAAFPCSLTRYHSADVNKNCVIEQSELDRVATYRSGYTTALVSATNPDGFMAIFNSTVGAVVAQLSASTPATRNITISTSNITSNVVMGVFSLKTVNQSGTISSLTFGLSGVSGVVNNLFQNVRLVNVSSGQTYGATSINNGNFVFNNLNLALTKDQFSDFKVVVDVKATSTASGSVAISLVGPKVVGVDSNYKTLNVGSVGYPTSNLMYFIPGGGISVSNINTTKGSCAFSTSGVWRACYTALGFTITNNGNNPIYISKGATQVLATTTSSGPQASSTVTSTVVSGSTTGDTAKSYLVNVGSSRTFTYNYTMDNTNGGTAGKRLSVTQINYGTSDSLYNSNINFGLENLYVQVP